MKKSRAALSFTLNARKYSGFAFCLAMFAFFWVAPLQSQGEHLTSYAVYNALQSPFATWGFVALGLGLTMIIGELDLSAAAAYGLGGVVAVKLGAHYPALGVIAAAGLGGVAGAVQGYFIARWSLNSMAVTLGGSLVMLGVGETITHSKSLLYPKVEVGINLDAAFGGIFSIHSCICFAAFLLVGLGMHFTRLGPEIRATGGDRRGARVAGVRTDRIICSVFASSGFFAALGGALGAYSVARADPNTGLDPLVFATMAALVGGVSLAGGHGTSAGILWAALGLSFLQATFGRLASPAWVAAFITGSVLIVVAATTAPRLRTAISGGLRTARDQGRRRTAGVTPPVDTPRV
jgi:ribose transport system permease protein